MAEPERWVVGIIELAVELESVTPESDPSDKEQALTVLVDEFIESVPPRWIDSGLAARWEDWEDGDSEDTQPPARYEREYDDDRR